jgi:Fe-S cluster biogenesis protein NfuA
VPTVSPAFTVEDVEAVLERIRPALLLDKGNVRLVAVEGSDVRLELTGSCRSCSSAPMTMRYGIEAELRRCLDGFGKVL